MIVTLEIEDLGEDRVRDDESPDHKMEKEPEDINVNENSENVAESVELVAKLQAGKREPHLRMKQRMKPKALAFRLAINITVKPWKK